MPKVEDMQASFDGRIESSVNPVNLRENQSMWSINTTSRGGIVLTRPGFSTVFNVPCKNPQGITMFTPTGGVPNLVFAVDGYVYVSAAPFKEYRRLENIRFYARSRFVTFADCLQAVEYDEAGTIQFLPTPKRVLVMQDLNTRAAFWDGGTDRHLNPTLSTVFDPDSGERITQPFRDETPIGLHMAWAGNRLWVSKGTSVFASDINNPLKFTETQYIAEGRRFHMPEDVTGMIQPSSGQPLIVFGERTITFLKANVIDRTLWLGDPDFQNTEYGIGCIAPRSIINKLGLVWWYSPNGWTNLNFALQSFNDSQQRYVDRPMDWSKRNLSVDKTGICAGETENYTLISVPSGDRWNRHTWVWDDYRENPGWDGVWMGVRPVQWAKGVVDGTERIFCLSNDTDGVIRIWEGMQPERRDNGKPVSCMHVTRYFNFQSGLNKRFQHAELYMREVSGDTELTAWSQSPRGPAQKALNVLFRPEAGSMSNGVPIGGSSPVQTLSRQFREIKTRQSDIGGAEDCGVCRIEAPRSAGIDRSFGLVLAWTGVLGLETLRLYANAGEDNSFEGACTQDDDSPAAINAAGCADDTNPYQFYFSEQTATATCPQGSVGDTVSVAATGFSIVSQRDADRIALNRAKLAAQGLLECLDGATMLVDDEEALIDNDENSLIT